MRFGAKICLVEEMGYPFFRILLANGDYGCGWLNSAKSLMTNLSSNVGECTDARLWNGGYLQLATADGFVDGVYPIGEGYVVIQPANDDCALRIKSVVVPDAWFTHNDVFFLEENESVGGLSMRMSGEHLVIGPVANDSNEEFPNRIIVMDPEKPEEAVSMVCPEELSTVQYVYVLPDLSGFIHSRSNGDVTLYDTEGNAAVLSQRESVNIGGFDDLYSFVADRYLVSNAVRRSDQAIVTARVCENQLQIWENGAALDPVEAPDGMVFQVTGTSTVLDFVSAGENGWILTALFADEEDAVVDAIGLYDTVSGKWQLLDTENIDLESFFAVNDAEGECFALGDNSGTVRIYDISNGKERASFPMLLPLSSVSQMQFAAEDKILFAVTEDNQIWIFDAESGEVVYREQCSRNIYDSVQVMQEEDGTRLYACWGDGGIVLEMDGWTKLADIPEMIGYDPVRDTVVCKKYEADRREYCLEIFRLPDTESLLNIGRVLLSGE